VCANWRALSVPESHRTAALCAAAQRARLLSVTGRPISSLPGCRQSVHVQDPAVLNALDPVGGMRGCSRVMSLLPVPELTD